MDKVKIIALKEGQVMAEFLIPGFFGKGFAAGQGLQI